MTDTQWLTLLGNILIIVIFCTSALFTPVVSLYWPWWKNGLGRSIVAKAIAMALVFLFPMLHVLFGAEFKSIGYQWFELACFGMVPVIFVWRAVAIWRLQRKSANVP